MAWNSTGNIYSHEIGLLRTQALHLLWRIFNIRGNHRISLAVAAWERIFERLEDEKDILSPSVSAGELLEADELASAYEDELEELEHEMFSVNNISSEGLNADCVPEPGAQTPFPIESLLTLFCRSDSKSYNP
jgi:hypothetical protein